MIQKEQKKKIIEKFLIIQDIVRSESKEGTEDYSNHMRPLFNLVFIHESYMNLGDLEQSALLSNFNFIPFLLSPMSTKSLQTVLIQKISHLHIGLSDFKMESFLSILLSVFSPFTCNIREFIYLASVCVLFYKDEGYSQKFKKILEFLKGNFYMHIIDQSDIEEGSKKKIDAKFIEDLEKKKKETQPVMNDFNPLLP